MTDSSERIGRAEAARERLGRAAVSAFADRGFHATTTRDIAAAAGLSPAAVYVHYRSKEELLAEISRTGHEHALRLVREVRAAHPGSPTQALRAVVHAFASDHARNNTSGRVVNYELTALSPQHAEDIRGLRRAIEAEMRGLVEDGVRVGEFDCPDPRMAATALLSLGIDVARWFQPGRGWSPEDVGEAYAGLALRLVGVDHARRRVSSSHPGGS